MEDITISVRTKYFHIFKEFFFDSFIKYHSEYLKHLNVYVDEKDREDELKKYKELSNEYCFNVHTLDIGGFVKSNKYRFFLWKSVSSEGKVLSFDDDIVFKEKGLFEILSKLLDKNKIIAEKYKSKNGNICMASWAFGINNKTLEYDLDSFATSKNYFCDGVDTADFTRTFFDDIYYFDDDVKSTLKITNRSESYYYDHLANKTEEFGRNVIDRI
jgi:hypothetical protein